MMSSFSIISSAFFATVLRRSSKKLILKRNPYNIKTLSLFSSFQPPEPPSSKGSSIYPNINIENKNYLGSSKIRNSDPNAVFVVSGASRGIGLQLVHDLLTRTKGKIVACCRSIDMDKMESLLLSGRVSILKLDLEDNSSINDVSEHISKHLDSRVDVLWNVAGILGDGTSTRPERMLSQVDAEWMEKSLKVNMVGPLLLSKALFPFMKKKKPFQHHIQVFYHCKSFCSSRINF